MTRPATVPAAGMLDRCRATNTCPKIFETFGALEFWYLRESPNFVGTDANADIPLPSNVRRILLPGHDARGRQGRLQRDARLPPNGCVLPANPHPEAETMAALPVATDRLGDQGLEPPPSRYPRLDRQLAPATKSAMDFPTIPGVPSPDGLVNSSSITTSVRTSNTTIFRGDHEEPPSMKQSLPTLVPKVDADGTDVGGVPSVLRQAPLGPTLAGTLLPPASIRGSNAP